MTIFRLVLRAASRVAAVALVALLAAACHDVLNGRNAGGFAIGGNVAGLVAGASVELSNGSGAGIVVAANGAFFFPALAPNGSAYDITVFTQPAGENCVVDRATGTVMGGAVTNVSVLCTPASYAVGGSVSGLTSGRVLVIQNDGAATTTVSADGMFLFSTGVPSGSNYAVTIRAQPDGQRCAITDGSGTVTVNDVLNVVIVCSDDTYNVGVSVAGLNAGGLMLKDNGGDALSVSRNGSFDFNTPVASGSNYAVTVSSQPVGEICTVTRGAGTIVDASISNVVVTCVANPYSVSGNLSGLYAGRSLVVEDNAGNATTLVANGGFTFSAAVASGSGYAVTVLTPPVGQSCSVTGGSGTVMGANVNSVAVNCSDNSYDIGVAVSGLLGDGLILQDNGTDNLSVPGNGVFNFNTPLPTGSAYSVSILTQPAHQTCAVTGGDGAVVGANVAGIQVTCTGEWTWMGPLYSTVNGNGGSYGVPGTPSTGNSPGARYEAAAFTDLSGKFWLFGGYGYGSEQTLGSDDLNDLWTYDPGTGAWTFVNGSSTAGGRGSYGMPGTPSAGNQPSARALAAAWTDPSGNFWLFGGIGYDSAGNHGLLNDLWKYIPASGSWIWMSGSKTDLASGTYGNQGVSAPGNVPGARSAAVSWTDAAGDLWLFGGQAPGMFASRNDLWKFDPGTGTWTWMSGSKATNQAGSYGTQGVAAPGNVPGARSSANAWLDSLGNLWLFGGLGLDANYNAGLLNDLWKFNPSDGTWTWEGGSATANGISSYGTTGIPQSSNVPGGRDVAAAWVDASGNFWLFGGRGIDSSNVSTSPGDLADLWEFSPATGLWIWIDGPSTAAAKGFYGNSGTPSFDNVPGSRQAAAPWIDSSGNFWLLGGSGLDSSGDAGYLNDLWKYTP